MNGVSVLFERRVRPPAAEGALVGCARLSPDGKRLAFARFDPAGRGVWLAEEGGQALQAASLPEHRIEDIAWSPDGRMLAYRMGEGEEVARPCFVGWAEARAGGDLDRSPADAFAWREDGSLLLLGGFSRILYRQPMPTGAAPALLEVADAPDACDPRHPIALAPAPGDGAVAVAMRSTVDQKHSLWICRPNGARSARVLVTEMPGVAAHVQLFWSPGGKYLGAHVAHADLGRSAILVHRAEPSGAGPEGFEGERIIESCLVDAPRSAAWAPSGKAMAWLRTVVDPADRARTSRQLHLVDLDTRVPHPLFAPAATDGEPRFLAPDVLVVDGGAEALVLGLSRPV
jgi:dipeptidyl aminopeptidase/acylaminoacyl peptidase